MLEKWGQNLLLENSLKFQLFSLIQFLLIGKWQCDSHPIINGTQIKIRHTQKYFQLTQVPKEIEKQEYHHKSA